LLGTPRMVKPRWDDGLVLEQADGMTPYAWLPTVVRPITGQALENRGGASAVFFDTGVAVTLCPTTPVRLWWWIAEPGTTAVVLEVGEWAGGY
jgi:hypothetical protein